MGGGDFLFPPRSQELYLVYLHERYILLIWVIIDYLKLVGVSPEKMNIEHGSNGYVFSCGGVLGTFRSTWQFFVNFSVIAR